MDRPLEILKGQGFADRLGALFGDGVPSCPLEGLAYRRILIPGLTGGEIQFALLGLVGQALRVRGAEVTALMCDKVLPACTLRKADHHESACTRWCHRHSGPFAAAMGLTHRWYGEFLDDERRAACAERAASLRPRDIPALKHRGIELGEHILRSLESYFKVGQADLDDPACAGTAREFAQAALYLVEIARRAVDELAPDKILLDDGRKTDWGIFRAVARARGIPVDVTGIGIRGTSVRFEVDRPPQPTARMAGWDTWRRLPLTGGQERELDAYLRRREQVPYEYRADFWRSGLTDRAEVRRRLDLRPGDGAVFAMFPNVGFDAGKTRSAAAAFPTAREWVAATIETIAARSPHRLVIKGHPAEHHRGARDTVAAFVRARFDPLPANIRLIDSDTEISAHSVVDLADVVLTYTSTVTAEAAALGKPVILAGGGWHAGRGIADEARTAGEYAALLERICAGAYRPPAQREMGRRYAYALFFRNDIPVTHFRRQDMNVTAIDLAGAEDLAPGRDPGLDAICRGVLFDEPFENPHTREASLAGASVS